MIQREQDHYQYGIGVDGFKGELEWNFFAVNEKKFRRFPNQPESHQKQTSVDDFRFNNAKERDGYTCHGRCKDPYKSNSAKLWTRKKFGQRGESGCLIILFKI